MNRERQLQLYQDFITNCTTNSKSLKNYIDFKRINECLQQLFPERKDVSILDFDDPIAFEEVVNELEGLKTYIDFNAKGKNQYSTTVSWYQRFLKAKHLFSKQKKTVLSINEYLDLPPQQIFYGAPGTGKSHKIKDDVNVKVADEKNFVFRTTFHPDSDYSTFVGCYKPTKVKTRKEKRMNLSLEDLAKELGSYYSNEDLGKISGIQKFCFEYYPYIDGEYMSVNVTKLLELAGIPKDYNVEINKYIKFCHLFPKQDPTKITYEYVPQSFTKAYLRAWQTKDPVFLVIEEINRGNCAQIFGDLFQLLDRGDDGVSEYPIKADNDLAVYIGEELAKEAREDIPENVKSGEELMLPSNLYIWATMNTSDQSLFPIDSAFKRRWDWTYIPIDTKKESWSINADGANYDWSDFLEKINAKIETATSSEDKMLGFYFCKADNDTITAEKFVNKVVFYLWNDVFKDYGFDDSIFNDDNNVKLTFRKFYTADGKVDESKVKRFLDNLEVKNDKTPEPETQE